MILPKVFLMPEHEHYTKLNINFHCIKEIIKAGEDYASMTLFKLQTGTACVLRACIMCRVSA